MGQAPNNRRQRIFARDAYRCVYCGRELPAAELTLDHVEPRMRGGDHSDGNLVTSCRPCNTEKSGQAAWAYLAKRPEQRSNFLALGIGVWPRLRRAVERAARS